MTGKKRLLLIRHGEIIEEYQGRYVGRADPPLSVDGRAACRQLIPRITALAPEKFYCSPLRRATETLEEIGGKPVVFDPRLSEIDFGDWERKSFDEIRNDPATTPEQLRLWEAHIEAFQFPGGESYRDFARRVDDFMADLRNDSASTIAVVTHGGILMRVISLWKNTPPERQWENLPPRGSLTVYDWHDGGATYVE